MRTSPPRVRYGEPRLKPSPKVKAEPYYDARWIELRNMIVRVRGRVCQGKDHIGDRHLRHDHRIVADHIVELKDGGELLDSTNIQLLCESCHQKKTMAARAARR